MAEISYLPADLLQNNLNYSATFEKIGEAFALILRGIPLTEESQKKIFNEIFNPEATVDYIDLATDEIVDDPDNEKAIIETYLESHSMANLLLTRIRDIFRPSEKKVLKKFIEIFKKNRTFQAENRGVLTNSTKQTEELVDLLLKVLTNYKKNPFFSRFIEVVKANPDKPFLVIQGHGDKIKGKWKIGERDGIATTNLNLVLEKMNISKYSAVVLISCNEKELTIEPMGVPIFYVKGLSSNWEDNFVPQVSE